MYERALAEGIVSTAKKVAEEQGLNPSKAMAKSLSAAWTKS